jgi:hypothetical protein
LPNFAANQHGLMVRLCKTPMAQSPLFPFPAKRPIQ